MGVSQPILFGEVVFFVEVTEAIGSVNWILIKKLDEVNIDWQKGFVTYSKVSRSKWIKVDWILSLIGVVRNSNRNLIITNVSLFL